MVRGREEQDEQDEQEEAAAEEEEEEDDDKKHGSVFHAILDFRQTDGSTDLFRAMRCGTRTS